ncbi:MAG: ATP phosphoribosyltransferase [Acidimicrobiia bacterium]
MSDTDARLRLAVPNKGRLKEPSLELLRDAGLAFEATERSLSVRVRNAEIDLIFVRTEDVPEMVTDRVADLGITGNDLLAEFEGGLEVVAELGFGRCRLAAAVPNASPIDKVEDFDGLRVATSHPRATRRFFDDRGVDVTVVPLRGSVEVAAKLGVADGIVDLVSTGSTLLVNGLREVDVILPSQAVLVSAGRGNGPVQRVATALRAVVAGRAKRYVLLNAPADRVETIADLIPGLEAPTVVPLAEDGWVAVHSVVGVDEVWGLLPLLEEAGGRGILVLPIEQLIP